MSMIYVFLLDGWQIIKVKAKTEEEAWKELPYERSRRIELLESYLLKGPWKLKGPFKLL